jgi:hypothetical protein
VGNDQDAFATMPDEEITDQGPGIPIPDEAYIDFVRRSTNDIVREKLKKFYR